MKTRKKVYHYLVIYRVNNYRNGVNEMYRECSCTVKTDRAFLANSLNKWVEDLEKNIDFEGYDNPDVTIQSLTKLN